MRSTILLVAFVFILAFSVYFAKRYFDKKSREKQESLLTTGQKTNRSITFLKRDK